jgi:hypothetical protein
MSAIKLFAVVFFFLLQDLRAAESVSVPESYFGIHVFYPPIEGLAPGTVASKMPNGFAAWRLHDAYKITWADLQPDEGKSGFHFDRADQYIGLARSGGMKVLWTLGYRNPAWLGGSLQRGVSTGDSVFGVGMPQSAAWSNYVKTVLLRYPGRIEAVEVWNEPDPRDAGGGAVFFRIYEGSR